jgi:hypothetical protein
MVFAVETGPKTDRKPARKVGRDANCDAGAMRNAHRIERDPPHSSMSAATTAHNGSFVVSMIAGTGRP